MNNSDRIAKLTLLLLYLTSWEELRPGERARKAWKGYDFHILNKLEENGFISQGKTSKSLYLTEEGLNEGKRLDEQTTIQ